MDGDNWTGCAAELTALADLPLSDSLPIGITERITAMLDDAGQGDLEVADQLITGLYAAIPPSTIRLRGVAVDIVGRLVSVRRARALRGDRGAQAALAESLQWYAGRLGADNRFLRAADAAQEAESAARELADSSDAAARKRHAQALHTLSVAQAAVGLHSAALAAASEAVAIAHAVPAGTSRS